MFPVIEPSETLELWCLRSLKIALSSVQVQVFISQDTQPHLSITSSPLVYLHRSLVLPNRRIVMTRTLLLSSLSQAPSSVPDTTQKDRA